MPLSCPQKWIWICVVHLSTVHKVFSFKFIIGGWFKDFFFSLNKSTSHWSTFDHVLLSILPFGRGDAICAPSTSVSHSYEKNLQIILIIKLSVRCQIEHSTIFSSSYCTLFSWPVDIVLCLHVTMTCACTNICLTYFMFDSYEGFTAFFIQSSIK